VIDPSALRVAKARVLGKFGALRDPPKLLKALEKSISAKRHFSNVNSKLRTYRLFKSEFCKEKYLCINTCMRGKYRSAFAKFRAGVDL
jgi:hypothetical protein